MTVAKIGSTRRQGESQTFESEFAVAKECLPVTITTPEGEVFEIDDTPINPGIITALAGEQTLRKFWDNPQEEKACQIMSEEI